LLPQTATTVAPPTNSPSTKNTASQTEHDGDWEINSRQAPALLKFFTKYDFEVDADVIQDKLFAAYNSIADQEDEQGSEHPDEEIARSHFHSTHSAPFSKPMVEAKDLCESHDLKDIFKNVDFASIGKKEVEKKKENKVETAAEKVEEEDEDDFIMMAISDDIGEEPSKKNTETEPEVPFGKNCLDYDLQGSSNRPTFFPVPYFTEVEKQTYDSESIEDFYVRFYGMIGTVIQPTLS
jgi:hypothetical protein